MDIEKVLIGLPHGEYGGSYRNDILDIYKIYLDMADRISARREKTNSYFLTFSTENQSVYY